MEKNSGGAEDILFISFNIPKLQGEKNPREKWKKRQKQNTQIYLSFLFLKY